MIVKPNAKCTAAATIALDATRVQVDHLESDRVEVNIVRPDGGTTTVSLTGSQGHSIIMRLVGHTEDGPPAEHRPAADV